MGFFGSERGFTNVPPIDIGRGWVPKCAINVRDHIIEGPWPAVGDTTLLTGYSIENTGMC
jgi:hypothetical protein